MTRVPTYNSYMNMVNQTLNTKSFVDLYSFQAQTGLKSPTYSGYGMSASAIVGSEAALGVVSNFMENNKIVETEVKSISTSLSSISGSIKDFKTLLTNFSGMDLESITPDYTGGEIVFGSNEDVYAGRTITVNGQTYTFTNNGDNTGNNIDLSTLTPGTDTYGTDVMNALKDKLQANDAENFADFTFDEETNTFSFPLYTIDGESTLLDAQGVTTGEPHTMSDEQAQTLKELQSMAFTTMMALTDCLNISVNGKYLFGGGVSTEAPVNFPFKTLEEFQAYYDGLNITYPTTGNANLSNYEVGASQTGDLELINNGGNSGTIKATNGSFLKLALTANESTTGDLTFNSDKNTIQATQYGAFNTLNPGDTLVINNAGDTHNGAYVIKSISADGKTITFEESTPIRADDTIANGGGATFSTSFPVGSVINMNGFDKNISSEVQVTGISPDGTELYVTMDPSRWPATNQTITASSKWSLESNSYYQGGDLSSEKRISDEQSIVLDVTAKDGVFEKMFRALGTIAQGNLVDTRNPLDGDVNVNPQETLERVEEALDLIQDALFSGGTNASSENVDLYTVQAKMDSNTVLLNTVNSNLTQVKANLENNVDSLKNVDQTEASIKLLLAVNQLNASYSVLQTAMSTSLLNYL